MSKFYEKRPSIQVEHGSGVRGAGKYGITWWGQQWLSAFNSLSEQGRMAKGRPMSSNGSVRSFEITKNIVKASVMGSSKYSILMEFPLFTKFEKIAIMDMVAERPDLISRLIAGELPSDLLELCEERNIGIFPKGWKRFTLSCSCPDKTQPCKPVSSILYLIANEIDDNPFVVFHMRGLDFVAEIAAAGLADSLETAAQIPLAADLIVAMPEVPEVFEVDNSIWDTIDVNTIPDVNADVAALLSDKPSFYTDGDFKDLLNKTLTKTAKQLAKAASKSTEKADAAYLTTKNIEVRASKLGILTDFTAWDINEEVVFETKSIEIVSKWLSNLPAANLSECSDELRAMWLCFHYAEALTIRGGIVPQLLTMPDATSQVRWIPATVIASIAEIHSKVTGMLPPYLLLYEKDDSLQLPVKTDYLAALVSMFINHFIKLYGTNNNISNPIFDLFFEGKALNTDEFPSAEHPAIIHLWLSRFFLAPKEEEEEA